MNENICQIPIMSPLSNSEKFVSRMSKPYEEILKQFMNDEISLSSMQSIFEVICFCLFSEKHKFDLYIPKNGEKFDIKKHEKSPNCDMNPKKIDLNKTKLIVKYCEWPGLMETMNQNEMIVHVRPFVYIKQIKLN